MPASEDNALLLRRFPYGESSLVVHALTRAHGRVALLARGAYRPKSAYCGVLDLFDKHDLWKDTMLIVNVRANHSRFLSFERDVGCVDVD